MNTIIQFIIYYISTFLLYLLIFALPYILDIFFLNLDGGLKFWFYMLFGSVIMSVMTFSKMQNETNN